MGKVKDHYWEEICAMAGHDEPEPDELEMLEIDAQRAVERYEEAKKKQNKDEHR